MLHILDNPHSGSGTLRRVALCHQLKKENIPYVLHTASSPEELKHLYPLWRITPADVLLVVGGDGSLNQVANLIPEKDAPRLLLLPSGSGNDFARGLRMKRGDAAAIHLIRSASGLKPCLIDCGEAGITGRREGQKTLSPVPPRRFMVSCGIGYDAGVCQAMESSRTKSRLGHLGLGKLSYLLLGVRGLFQYKKASGTLTLDRNHTVSFRNLAFLSCHNLPFEGGGFCFAPGAAPRDGRLTVCLITAKNRLAFTLTLIASLFRLHGALPNVRFFTCEELAVHTDAPLPFHMDGEVTPSVTDFTVRILPARIPLLFEPGKD